MVLALALTGYLLWRRRRQRTQAWYERLAHTRPDVRRAADLLTETPDEPIDPTRLEALHHQIDATAVALGGLAASAPSDDARMAASDAEQAMRGAMGALDTEQLLRTGPTPPPAPALADSRAARQRHTDALEAALARLDLLARSQGDTETSATGTADPSPPV